MSATDKHPLYIFPSIDKYADEFNTIRLIWKIFSKKDLNKIVDMGEINESSKEWHLNANI
jgi:hypothetical protein